MELKDVIMEGWGKVDRKKSLSSKTSRLYPFKAKDVKHLENAPLVDAALMRLAKHVSVEDAMSFKDGLERRIDQDLKRIYEFAGIACKTALAAMSKAMEAWTENMNLVLRCVSEEVSRGSAVQELKLASAFLGEASIDIIHLLAWAILSLVTAGLVAAPLARRPGIKTGLV